jgi:hypothetical protein
MDTQAYIMVGLDLTGRTEGCKGMFCTLLCQTTLPANNAGMGLPKGVSLRTNPQPSSAALMAAETHSGGVRNRAMWVFVQSLKRLPQVRHK